MITIEEFLSYNTNNRSKYIEDRIYDETKKNLLERLEIDVPDDRHVSLTRDNDVLNILYNLEKPIPGDTNLKSIYPIEPFHICFRRRFYAPDKFIWVWIKKRSFPLRNKIYVSFSDQQGFEYKLKKGELTDANPLKYLMFARKKITKYQDLLKRLEEEYQARLCPKITELTEESIKSCIDFKLVIEAWNNYLDIGVDDDKYIYLYLILYQTGTSILLTREIREIFKTNTWGKHPPASKETLDQLEEFLKGRIPKVAESISEATIELKKRIIADKKDIVNRYGIFMEDITVTINGEEI